MRWFLIIYHIFLFLNGQMSAQGELTLPTLNHLLESDRYNPAISNQEEGWHIGLPSFGYNAFHTGPGYRGLIREEGGRPILQVQNLAKELNGENSLLTDFRLQTVKLKRRVANWSFGFEHEVVFHAQIRYPDELILLYTDGNQPWIGQTVDIAPSATIYSYNNYAFPISYRGKKLSVGFRPRLLLGNQFGRTPVTEASLHTSEDFYQLTLTTNYKFENVGIVDFSDANLLNYQIDNLRQWSLFTKHFGLGIDLGVQLEVSDQAKIALSISDLGYINWSDVRSYRSQRVTEYVGFEVTDLFQLGQIDFEDALDSLDAIFDVEVDNQEIRFSLPMKWHAHFSYQLNEAWRLSSSLTYQSNLSQPWNIGVVVTSEVKDNFFIGASIMNRHGALAFGVHGTLQWGRFTGFLVSDQLIKGLDPLRANHFNLRGGVNVKL